MNKDRPAEPQDDAEDAEEPLARREALVRIGALTLVLAGVELWPAAKPAGSKSVTVTVAGGKDAVAALRDAAAAAPKAVRVSVPSLDRWMLHTSELPLFVVPQPHVPGGLLALDARCPHAGCIVEWRDASRTFVCPCHDARFTADGKKLQGPSPTDLVQVPLTVTDDSVVATLSGANA